MTTPRLTTAIATLASAERAEALWEAIGSIKAQTLPTRPLVVVNGTRAAPELVAELQRTPGIDCLVTPTPGLTNARQIAADAIDGDAFGFLDDDDLLLPGANEVRWSALAADPNLDVVSAQGLLRSPAGDEAAFRQSNDTDLARRALEAVWANSASCLFRTGRLPPRFFADCPDMLEWTVIAARLALAFNVALLEDDVFVVRVGADEQMSRSLAYTAALPRGLEKIATLPGASRLRPVLRTKLGKAWHHAAEAHRRHGDLRAAWACHLRCLTASPGAALRYLSYTRHLLSAPPRP